jgi:hypothetical protein
LLEKLTSSQLAEWYSFNNISPIGDERDDYRISFLASMITNLAIRINGKKGAKLTSVKDFIFDWGVGESSGTKMQSLEEMKNVFYQIAAAGRISEKEKEKIEQRRKHKPVSHKK